MKLLLTSGGISNASIRDALVELLGKPIAECKALIIPTAIYAFAGGAGSAWRIISGNAATPLAELGWKELGVLELTALPSIPEEYWVAEIQTADALLVSGGDPPFLSYWMQESGLASRIPSLKAVYVGVSAGSLVMGPRVGEEFVYWKPPSGDDRTLAIVDFSMFPHLDHPAMPDHSMTKAEEWAAKLSVPAYALDDQTAIKVNEASIEVISEGRWKLFTPSRGA